jgi:DNA-3-methyladenine glycosylase II
VSAAPPPAVLAAEAQLCAADPVMAQIITDVGGVTALPDRRTGAGGMGLDHYGSLVRSIVGQQLSTTAARAIFLRLTERYGGRTPTPAEVLAEDPDELRAAAGLSRAKTQFLRSLAEHVLEGSLELERLDELPDEAVIAELVAVKGIGDWSAQIFLMFHLGRPDVLPVGDLGIRKAVMLRYGLPALPAPAELEAIGEPWRPHRTLACRFLWASLRLDAVPA